MLAALLENFNSDLVIKDVDFPIRKNSMESIIRVEATGLCHGDLHIIKGDWNYFIKINLPKILGHEVIGRIVESDFFSKGDLVAVYNILGCNECRYCKVGKPQYCNTPKFLGIDFDGGFAEYMLVPDNSMLFKVEGDPIALAPLVDSGITAYNAVKDIEENASILIIGTSAVAQIALQILKYKNVGEIIVVGRNMKRLEIFERFGADTIIPLENYERLSENLLKVLGNKKKFDYILDFIGSDNTLRDIIWFLAKNGELRIIGEFGGNLQVNENLLVLRGLRIKGILYGDKSDFIKVYKLYKNNIIKIITTKYSLYEINKAIKDLYNGNIITRAVITPQ